MSNSTSSSVAAANLHLSANSPAINKGEALDNAGSLDIDGQSRIEGSAIDIGADEISQTTRPAGSRL